MATKTMLNWSAIWREYNKWVRINSEAEISGCYRGEVYEPNWEDKAKQIKAIVEKEVTRKLKK